MATVSIIIPTYNAAHLIERAITSVLQQDFKDYEIIVVDDGSEDDTRELLDKYKERLTYIYQQNTGAASARNTGIKLAKGCYIAFLDADDEWHHSKLSKQLNLLKENPGMSWVYTDLAESKNGKITHESYLRELDYEYVGEGCVFDNLLLECFVFTPTVIVEKDAITKVGLFNQNLQVFEDLDLWLKLSKCYNAGFIDESLVTRHIHDQNLTSNRSLIFSGYSEFMGKLQREQKLTHAQRKIIKLELANWNKQAGIHYLEKGESLEARSYFLKSLQQQKRLKTAALFMLSTINDDYASLILELYRRIRKIT